MKLYSIASNLHNEIICPAGEEKFIVDIERQIGERFTEGTELSGFDRSDSILYVRTGGTEGIFKDAFCKTGKPVIKGEGPVRLLASGQSNSLAASMEILSYLRKNGIKGEILHGSAEEIAYYISKGCSTAGSGFLKPLDKDGILAGKRFGVIGKPSDWLISSDVDYDKAKRKLGCELIDIDIRELVDLIRKGGNEKPQDLKGLNAPKFGKPVTPESFDIASQTYGALKTICSRYSLNGFTLRCFDLLTAVGNTGCLALAKLNSEGYTATCEGDIPAMLSMAIAREESGMSGFQVNLSRIVSDSLLFAHCTVPLDMVKDYCYDTHFESGIGVGIHGEFEEGIKARLFKISADLEKCCDAKVLLSRNQYEDNLCRTQVWIEAPGLKNYLLREPLGNHHVLIIG